MEQPEVKATNELWTVEIPFCGCSHAVPIAAYDNYADALADQERRNRNSRSRFERAEIGTIPYNPTN